MTIIIILLTFNSSKNVTSSFLIIQTSILLSYPPSSFIIVLIFDVFSYCYCCCLLLLFLVFLYFLLCSLVYIKQYLALKISQMLNKHHEELENKIVDTKKELQTLDIELAQLWKCRMGHYVLFTKSFCMQYLYYMQLLVNVFPLFPFIYSLLVFVVIVTNI